MSTAAVLRTRRKARTFSSPVRLQDDVPFLVRRSTNVCRPKLLGWILATASLLCGFLLLAPQLVRHFQQDGGLRHHHQSVRNANGEKAVFSPWDSHPPKPGILDAQHNPRHACLAQIRARQVTMLGKYLTSLPARGDQSAPIAKRILLVDPAYHSNVGDHMITVAELQFLQPRQQNHTTTDDLHQCSYVQAGAFVPPCELEIPRLAAANREQPVLSSQPTAAVWHGGGNWGDLWRRAQEPRIASFEILLQYNFYPIVTMPNSWYYRNKGLEVQDVQAIRSRVIAGLIQQQQQQQQGRKGDTTIMDHDIDDARLQQLAPLVLTWREQSSYERAQELLPWAVHLLVPDIAFQLGPYDAVASAIRSASAPQRKPQQGSGTPLVVDLLFQLRDDHESLYANQRNRRSIRDVLQSVPGASQFTFSIVDWKDRLDRFSDNDNSQHSKDDIFFTDTAVQLLALGRIVVCDRLHAAILAYLAGLPFIYLDQVSGKISKTLSVAMDSGEACRQDAQWSAATDLKDAVRQAVDFMNRYQLQPSTSATRDRRQHRQT